MKLKWFKSGNGEKNAAKLTLYLLGNPNVGKSTVFNALTGMNQHTGIGRGRRWRWLMATVHMKEKHTELWICRVRTPCPLIRRRRSWPGNTSAPERRRR